MRGSSFNGGAGGGVHAAGRKLPMWSLLLRVAIGLGCFTAFSSVFIAGYVDYSPTSVSPAVGGLLAPRAARAAPVRLKGAPVVAPPSSDLLKLTRARPPSDDETANALQGYIKKGADGHLSYDYRFEVMFSPKPSMVPKPSPIYSTRNCECDADWESKVGGDVSVCRCSDKPCPPRVNPPFLTEAAGQHVCSLERHTGIMCTVGCDGDKVYWYGHACGGEGQPACPELVVSPTPSPSGHPPLASHQPPPKVDWDPEAVMDLRGAQCEMLDGKERCFTVDSQGRELCPEYVTSEYLANPRPGTVPAECFPPHHEHWYCTIMCQQGNNYVRWWPQEVNRCYGSDYGNCPTRIPPVPKAQYTVGPWSGGQDEPLRACQAAALAGVKPREPIPELSVGLLTHEPVSFAASMKTYEEQGFFDLVPEFMIFVNGGNPAVHEVIKPYKEKYGSKIRVLGDGKNHGIARGIVYLTANATYDNFLFLERDFWLIEPATCVDEQLRAGLDLLKKGAADVVRYRSRRHAGRPNWAESFFRGHEWDAFVGRQPNLGCNIYYWMWDVEETYPQYFWTCGKDPQMLCSDSFYCNWTNNPQLWSVKWWNREYVERFDKFRQNDPVSVGVTRERRGGAHRPVSVVPSAVTEAALFSHISLLPFPSLVLFSAVV